MHFQNFVNVIHLVGAPACEQETELHTNTATPVPLCCLRTSAPASGSAGTAPHLVSMLSSDLYTNKQF